MARHQSQCSIFVTQQLKVSNIFLCSCCFRPTATCQYLAFVPLLTHAHQPVYRLLSLSKVQPFSENCATIVICSVSKTRFPQCLDPSFIFVRYFTHNQSYRPNCDYGLKYWRIYGLLCAMLHVNIEIMTSQQSHVVLVAQLLQL